MKVLFTRTRADTEIKNSSGRNFGNIMEDDLFQLDDFDDVDSSTLPPPTFNTSRFGGNEARVFSFFAFHSPVTPRSPGSNGR